ncbi:MAG: leucine-rich repeat domain-containing protein [Clostridia bacterium]
MKRVCSIVLVVTMVCSMVWIETPTVFAAQSGKFTYTVASGKATITKYTGTVEDLSIPATLGGYPVTKIGNRAFIANINLASVVMGKNVTNVEYGAFNACANLRSVSFTAGIKILGDYSFAGCVLLRNAYFLGNAPTLYIGVFDNCDPYFKVTYLTGKTGFGNPWYGYPTKHVASLVPKAPTVNVITNKALSISGKAAGECIVYVTIGSQTKRVKANGGKYKVTMAAPCPVGTKVKVSRKTATMYSSPIVTKTVIPAKPVLQTIHVNNIYIKGSATKGAMVYVKIYGKNYKGKASTSSGKFSIKVPKVLVEAEIQVYCKILGLKSQIVKINV